VSELQQNWPNCLSGLLSIKLVCHQSSNLIQASVLIQ